MSLNPPECKFVNFVGTYSCGQVNLRKERERELATFSEKSHEHSKNAEACVPDEN